MNTKATEMIINLFTKFGVLYQLPAPDPEYVIAVQEYLSAHKWKLSELNGALNALLKDEKYAETARFGKYPAISDFFRVKQQIDSKLAKEYNKAIYFCLAYLTSIHHEKC